jgi:hypothetical protein
MTYFDCLCYPLRECLPVISEWRERTGAVGMRGAVASATPAQPIVAEGGRAWRVIASLQ